MFDIDPLQIVLSIPAILIAFTFHEFAHAIVADKLGDRTPRFQGRITLNPLAHIDIIGFIMFIIAHFGWAKPVQTNPSAFRNYYKDHLKVAIAGPVANLTVAIVFTPIFLLYSKYINVSIYTNKILYVIYLIILYIITYNVLLFVLNLLPIPGFDGYHVLADLFPSTFNKIDYKIGNYQIFIMIACIYLLGNTRIVSAPSDWIIGRLFYVFSLII